MEVSGKRTKQKTFSASRESAEDFLLYCFPCDREGIREPAYGYCKDCQEHLCESCFKHHRKPAPLRNHVLLGKDAMPQTLSVPTPREEFDICGEHGDALKFYCRDHGVIVCNICVTLDHRVCKIDYIPKLSENILEESELQGIMAGLNVLKETCESKARLARENKKIAAKAHVEVLKEIQNFRNDVNACLDQMERNITEEANSLIKVEQTRLETLSKACEDIVKEVEEVESSFKILMQGKHFNRLFIEMKKAKPRCAELEAKRSETHHDSELLRFEFVKNEAILEMLQKQTEIGKLMSADAAIERRLSDISVPSENKTVVLKDIGEIDAKSVSDENECSVTGIEVMQTDMIVACDEINKKIKCFNTMENKMVSEIELSSSPFDIAAVPQNKIAVTVPDERSIYILSLTDTNISTDRRINVKEECNGVAYCQDKLVVSCNFNPGKVIIVNLRGQTIRSFSEKLFTFPQYMAVNAEGTYIYVSDCGYDKNAVQKLDWQGNVVSSFKIWDTDLQGIQELDDSTFLLCRCINNNNKIVRISSSCKQCKVTGHEKFGNIWPRVIKYCKKTRTLYVSYSEENIYKPSSLIKILKIDWY